MRISDFIATPIALADPPLLNAAGLHAPYALRIVIQMASECGIVGVSEIPGNKDVLLTLDKLKGQLIGRSVFDLNNLFAELKGLLGDTDLRGETSWDQRRFVHIFSAIEVASLDMMGKKLDCRVADLMGGPVREKVPYCGYLFFKYEGAGGKLDFNVDPNASGWMRNRQAEALHPQQIVDQANAMIDAFGFKSLKLKAGILDPEVEVDSIFALRDALGEDIPLRIDPNAVWSYETALHYGRKMQGCIEYYEDPVRGQDMMGKLRQKLDIPFATNMCTTSFGELPESIRLHSEDIILSDHHFWGGLRASVELARICDVFGRGFSMHSNSHAGISLAAMTQLGAVIKNLNYALDTHYPWQVDDILAGGKLSIIDGCVQLPDTPGLGVEIDPEALDQAHKNYKECGLEYRDDERAMQRKQPGWKFKAVRY